MKIIILILLVSSPVYSMRIGFPHVSAGNDNTVSRSFVGPVQPINLNTPSETPRGATSTADTRLLQSKDHAWHSDPGYYKHVSDFKQGMRDMEMTRMMGNAHAQQYGR